MEILIITGVGTLVVLLLAFAFLAVREIGKTRRFFDELAERYRGQRTRLPFGVVFTLGRNLKVKVFALQGAILYKADVRLQADPGVLITRSYPGLRWLDRLNYAPGRTRISFGAPIDTLYAFRGRDPRWIREIFTPELQEALRSEGRISRIEIRRKRLRGAVLMLWFSPAETEKARQSIEILNAVARRVAASSLAPKWPPV